MGWLQKAGAQLFPWKETELCPKAETVTKQSPACWKSSSISHLVRQEPGTHPQSHLWSSGPLQLLPAGLLLGLVSEVLQRPKSP